MELKNTTNKTTANFGRWSGTVHWHAQVAAVFPTEEDRLAIIALFTEAMRLFDTVEFYLNHTKYKDIEIAWHSTADEQTLEIQIEAELSQRGKMLNGQDEEFKTALMEELEFYRENFINMGRSYPDTIEEYQEEFYQWKEAREAGK